MSNEKEKSFEEAYAALEALVAKLEEGKLTLAETTALYEEGVRLANLCNRLLSAAELKITTLRDSELDAIAEPPADYDVTLP